MRLDAKHRRESAGFILASCATIALSAVVCAGKRSGQLKDENSFDSRLARSVAVSLKHASMTEVCTELTRQTGVNILAGRNVRDENVTIFVKSRPAREVMHEISQVFGFSWEVNGESGRYTYRLKQDTASEIAEEKLRSDDIAAAIQALTKKVQRKQATQYKPLDLSKAIFADLLPDELERLQSGKLLTMATSGSASGEDLIDPDISKELIVSMGGVKPWMEGFYMATGDLTDRAAIPFSSMKDAGATVGFRLKVTEFGGASVSTDFTAHGTTDKGAPVGTNFTEELGSVKGVAEEPIENAKSNAALRDRAGMDQIVTVSPRPSISISRQGENPTPPDDHTIANTFASYRFIPGLQPPRPFMSSDDYWQAIHDSTGKDVIADSYSRLFKLTEDHGSVFDVLSRGCDQMHYLWSVSDGFFVGRSKAFYWQRTSEVPKARLLAWSKRRLAKGFLPLENVLEMAEQTDRQLDSIEVGKTIVYQWMLPEWGIPSRPRWTLAKEPVRPICRFLGTLAPDQLESIVEGKLKVSAIPRDLVDMVASLGAVPSDTILGVDYVPPGKYFWNPIFELNKETVHTDLIIGNTQEEVEAEVHRRYPERPTGEVTLSNDGTLGLIIQTSKQTYMDGDSCFNRGHRGPGS